MNYDCYPTIPAWIHPNSDIPSVNCLFWGKIPVPGAMSVKIVELLKRNGGIRPN